MMDPPTADQLVFMALVAVPAGVCFGVYAYFTERARRRRYRAALQRVRERTPCSDEEFVRKLGLDPMTRDAEVAVGIRKAFADCLGISPQAITPTTSFRRDLDMLSLCDSLDILGIVFRIEEQLHLAIPNRVLSIIPSPFVEDTFGEMIHGFLDSMASGDIRSWSERKLAKQRTLDRVR